jgi:hypothetical protein
MNTPGGALRENTEMLETRHEEETELRWYSQMVSDCWGSSEACDRASSRWLNGSRIKHSTLRLGKPATWGRS